MRVIILKVTSMQTDEIKRLIEAGLPGAEAHVEGDGAHFTATVISALFKDQSRLKKQQLVYDTVRAQLLDGSLHALSIKALTPEEWHELNTNL